MDKCFCKVVSALLLAGVLLTVGPPTVQAQEELFADTAICNGTVENGTIVLSNLSKTTCHIIVQRPANTSVKFTTITFSVIDLEGTDTLTIYDGKDSLTVVRGRRESLVVVIGAVNASLVVNITGNQSTSVLKATYDFTGCSVKEQVSTTSRLQSPVYLAPKANFTCNYLVSKADDANTQLALSFLQVSLLNATLSVTTPEANQTVAGGTLPPDMYSTGDIQMVLEVKTKANTSQNFSATVSPIVTSEVCGQTKDVGKDLMTFNIMVPETHPLHYDCRLTLNVSNGNSLWLNITSLQLADQGDSVVVVDGPSLGSSQVLGSFTAAVSGHLLLSSQSQVLVRLLLGEMVGARSLSISAKELDGVSHLYGSGNFTITPSSGNVMVSQYFLLEAPDMNSVRIDLAKQTVNKTYNYNVSVYDGCQTSAPLLVTFSSDKRVPVVSSGKKMLVVAQVSNTSEPLSASFSSQPSGGCDKVTSASEGSWRLTSPSVPPSCSWTITAPPQNTGTILLDLTSVQLSENASLVVYSGVAGSGGTMVASLSAATVPSPVPSVAVSASQWAQVSFSSGNLPNVTSVAFNVRFQLLDTLCGGSITASQGHLRSPAFPNLYPLNSLCQWTFPSIARGRLLFFDFPQFSLASNHSLTIEEKLNGTSRVVGSFRGSASLPDVLYASKGNNTVTFSAQMKKPVAVASQMAQGFDVQYWSLNCGGYTNESKGSFSTPNYPTPIPVTPANATLCVWFIQLPNMTKQNVNIVNATLTVQTTGSPPVSDLVKVYDGDSVRKELVMFIKSEGKPVSALSRRNSVIIVFNISASASSGDDIPKIGLRVNYTTFSCNKTSLCKNGLCMHPDWICNGKDDCGDNSDEKNCVVPIPPKSSSKGMKPGIVVLLFFVGLLLGIVLAVVIPRIIRRFRTNRYASFQNEPAVA